MHEVMAYYRDKVLALARDLGVFKGNVKTQRRFTLLTQAETKNKLKQALDLKEFIDESSTDEMLRRLSGGYAVLKEGVTELENILADVHVLPKGPASDDDSEGDDFNY